MTTSNSCQKISLNDSSEYGMCFACGPKNSSGLKLFFKHKDKGVETSFEFDSTFQGFPNYMHGGIISTVLDETMNRAALSQNYWVLTAQLDVKFKQPIIINQKIYAEPDSCALCQKSINQKIMLLQDSYNEKRKSINQILRIPRLTILEHQRKMLLSANLRAVIRASRRITAIWVGNTVVLFHRLVISMNPVL